MGLFDKIFKAVPEEDKLFLDNVAERSRAFRLLAGFYTEGRASVASSARKGGGLFGMFRAKKNH